MTSIIIPSLLGMIVMGCVARNYCGSIMNSYPTVWAGYIRSICIAVILTRGGFGVTFRGKGLLVLLMSFVPSLFEAVCAAFIAKALFGMPVDVAFAFAFSYVGAGVALIVPIISNFNE